MIDPSKIRVGDEVTVRCTVKEIVNNGHDLLVLPSQNPRPHYHHMCVSPNWIATHTPKPRDFKPGERIRPDQQPPGVIIAIDGEYAWVRDYLNNLITYHLSRLSHADE